jgi:hypothetical protein
MVSESLSKALIYLSLKPYLIKIDKKNRMGIHILIWKVIFNWINSSNYQASFLNYIFYQYLKLTINIQFMWSS